MAPFECYFYDTNYFSNLVFSTVYPIVVSAILMGLHARDKGKKGSPWFSAFLAANTKGPVSHTLPAAPEVSTATGGERPLIPAERPEAPA